MFDYFKNHSKTAKKTQNMSTLSSREMLREFYNHYNHGIDLSACLILDQYLLTKSNEIPRLLAHLFQYRFSYLITETVVNQAIAQLNCPSSKPDITTTTEMWIALDQFQPSQPELTHLFNGLRNDCDEWLILDLIKLIHQYLSGNFSRLFIGMQLYALDTVRNWNLATITQILWMPVQNEYFIYIVYDGWSNKWNEWIPVSSGRLKWMQNKQGQLVTVQPEIDCICPGDFLDFLHYPPLEWKRVKIVAVNGKLIDIEVPNANATQKDPHSSYLGHRFAPLGTFT